MNSNEKLTMIDIMKELKCTRYTVMKYYAQDELPLVKEGNKYYITKSELEKWIEYMNKKRRFQSIIIIVIIVIVLAFFAYIFDLI